MELSSANIKKVSYIISKEYFSYIFSNETLHFSPQARKIKETHPEKKFFYSRKRKLRKNLLCFLKRKIFLYFRKRKR